MNKRDVILTEKVRKRVFVMDQPIATQITSAQAAELLRLSVRQIKRIKKQMLSNGIWALGHGNAGRKPKHALDPAVAVRIVELAQTDLKDADCILSRNRMDIAVLTDAVKRYARRSDKNLNVLMQMAEAFGIAKPLLSYMEVLL